VTLIAQDTGTTVKKITDDSGDVAFTFVPGGTHTLSRTQVGRHVRCSRYGHRGRLLALRVKVSYCLAFEKGRRVRTANR
jgi:hypothetical protein